MEMAAVQFANVSKRFILRHERPHSFQEMMLRTCSKTTSHFSLRKHRQKCGFNFEQLLRLFDPRHSGSSEELWALRDVSFTVKQGESVGIIGPNGAGKSTVLKLVSRIIEPTSGRIQVNGRIGALLELGSGFHPDLTGRENIYLDASILGLSRAEVNRKLDAIIAFAELEHFIDVPLKYYSSGMCVRLGFSVAAHTEPEILLVDEVLAVGDYSFQRKCIDRINYLKDEGRTIVFVSHALDVVRRICTRVVWMDRGRVRADGDVDTIVDDYISSAVISQEQETLDQVLESPDGKRWGTGEVEIVGVDFLDSRGNQRWDFETGEQLRVLIRYEGEAVMKPVFGIAIYRSDGAHIAGPNTKTSGYDIESSKGQGEVELIIDSLPLLPGIYLLSTAIYDDDCVHAYDHHEQRYIFRVKASNTGRRRLGTVDIPCRWEHRPSP
jgi:lipopolysaccharide transport system ATP-binding protein